MARSRPIVHDVFTAREIARAAGASIGDADALLASGLIASRDGGLTATAEAVRAVLMLRGQQAGPSPERTLFSPLRSSGRRRGVPLTASGFLHAAFGAMLLTAFGMTSQTLVEPQRATPPRLVFLVKPGPGGGGGGGGLRQPAPARPAKLKGTSALKSPVPVERAVRRPVPEPPRPPRPDPPVRPVERPVEPPPPVAKPDPDAAGRRSRCKRAGRPHGTAGRPHSSAGRAALARVLEPAGVPVAAAERASEKAKVQASATALAAGRAADPIGRVRASRRRPSCRK